MKYEGPFYKLMTYNKKYSDLNTILILNKTMEWLIWDLVYKELKEDNVVNQKGKNTVLSNELKYLF